MHRVEFDSGGAFPGRPVDQLRRRLEHQELLLSMVLGRFGQERRDLELPGSAIDWGGPAQVLYSIGLLRLAAELASAGVHLDNALRETRRAIASLDSRGG